MDIWRKSRYIMRSFIILIFCWLGWLCGLAFGQVSEAFTSAANFPDAGLTCLANLAAFFNFILRGKGSYENVATGNEAIENVKKKNINGLKIATTCGEQLQECSVVLLSFQYYFTFSAWRLMNHISGVYDVHSILLRCCSLHCGTSTEDLRKCSCTENRDGRCGCIEFKTVEDITMMLARRLPGTLKRLPHSHCLIPSVRCMRNGCHGCNKGLLHVDNDILTEGDPDVASPAAVCEILDQLESIHKVRACICIPVRPSNEDEWTNQLITFFKPQDKELRGVVLRKGGINASSALENYKNRNGQCDADETYSLASLAILPFLTGPLIIFVLTFCLKVDGFSSVAFAVRVVESYYKLSVSLFMLTRACVKSNANSTNVCQVLFLRPACQPVILIVLWGFSASICFIGWTVLVAKEGGAHKWYHIQSMAPSEGCIAIGRVGGIKSFGRWIYSALQCLVLAKWLSAGLIRCNCQDALRKDSPEDGKAIWWYGTCGHYIAASAFLLNATLAAVRSQWIFS